MWIQWEDLPDCFKTEEVKPYWESLNSKRGQMALKRALDLELALIMLLPLSIPMVAIGIAIKTDSEGPVFYRQDRVTTYGKHFRIHKFRTMVSNAEKIGTAVTIGNDSRITKIGSILRKYRLDELPQIFDVIAGNMSFVGTRPEAVKYVRMYEPEYYATLLMPAGITSEASIRYKDEANLLYEANDVDSVYMNQVLPEKMKYNLEYVETFSFLKDIQYVYINKNYEYPLLNNNHNWI
jgi:lipopolysaccharide/colanic/teichoic acid biosynthesis glycosyltransferase